MDYKTEVTARLTLMLREMPKDDQQTEMQACESVATASGFLDSTPRRDSPQMFSLDLVNDPAMSRLVEKDRANRLAMSAESPVELVTNLMPSDSHLD